MILLGREQTLARLDAAHAVLANNE